MATSIKSDLQNIGNTFSIKNFIPDLPKMLNATFNMIASCILNFYDPDTKEISCNKVTTGTVSATTIIAQNISFKGGSGNTEIYNYGDIMDRLEAVESKLNNITPISKDRIDQIAGN